MHQQASQRDDAGTSHAASHQHRKGAEILATLHGGDLASYNGGPHAREHGYPEKIRAILSALVGIEVRVKGHRMRELVRRIVRASGPPKS